MRKQERRRAAGRPLKPTAPGTRVSLGLKVTPAIKAKLDAAARANGRTQSQEAEARLERSFDRQGLLHEVLTLAYGDEDLARELMRAGDALSRAMLDAALQGVARGETAFSVRIEVDPSTGQIVGSKYEKPGSVKL